MGPGASGEEPEAPAGLTVRQFWGVVFRTWDDVTAVDLHETYGIDQLDPTLPERPWWWLRRRIFGLLDRDSRLTRTIQKET
jgi:hypothetical protein